MTRVAPPSGSAGVPVHLVLGSPGHGVTRYAGQVASWVGAPVRTAVADVRPGERVHLHLSDRVVADDLDAAAEAVERLAARTRLTVTLHDVPQPTDGDAFRRRAACYHRIVAAVDGWVTSSVHERRAVERWCAPPSPGGVVPLPVIPAVGATSPRPRPGRRPTLGVFGFVYPGKGHVEALDAAARLRGAGRDVGVVFLGAPARGHEDDLRALGRRAGRLGVPLRVTGAVPEEDVAGALRSVTVPVVGHRNVSASGSLNSWLAAGRRPLVREGAYAREMAQLRPGTVDLYRDEDLAEAVAAALDAPAGRWLPVGVDLRPGPAEVADRYRAWWAATLAEAA